MESVPEWVDTVTFLFTDIEGSSERWESDTAAMRQALARHDALLRQIIDTNGGEVFKTIGDEFCAAFVDAVDAVAAAEEAQRALLREVPGLRVRMALHTGEAERRDGDYFGPALNRVARLLDAAHGGQVLLSQATRERVEGTLSSEAHLHWLGVHRLRDLRMSESIYQLQAPDLPSDFPPPNTLDVAFRRGLVRALAISAVVVTVMAGLLLNSILQTRRADRSAAGERQATLQVRRVLALDQAKHGVEQLEAGNGLGLLDLIEARRTADSIPDLREAVSTLWAGWHQAYAGRLISAVGHDGMVLDVKFSPDGKLLATASEDKTVKLWSTRTWELAAPPLPHDNAVHLVAFSADGKLLATAAENQVRLWNTATGKPRGGPMKHDDLVNSLAFRGDGKLLASGSRDGTARLWDTETGRARGRALRPDGGAGHDEFGTILVGFAPPDGNQLVAATKLSVSLWDTSTGARRDLLLRRERPSRNPPALAFSEGWAVRAIASDTTVWLWDEGESRFRRALLPGLGTVEQLALSPDGSRVATALSNAPTVQLWPAPTGRGSVPPLWLPSGAEALAFGPAGSDLLATLSRRAVRFWHTTTGQPAPEPSPPDGGVTAMALSPDGRTVATVTAHGTVHLWAVASQPQCRQLPLPTAPLCMAFRENDAVLATYSQDGLRLWSAESGQLLGRPTGAPEQSQGAAFSQDGEFLVTWKDRNVSLWPTRSGRLRDWSLRLQQRVRYAALSRHGSVLATLSPSDTVRLWEAVSGRPRGVPLRHPPWVSKLVFSPDESLVATAGGDSVRLWDADTGQARVSPIHIAGTPEWIAFSPDGRLLAVASQDGGAVTLWSTANGQQYLHPLQHPSGVTSCAFSPDGKLLATTTMEHTVRLWDLATGLPHGQPMRHPDWVLQLRFSLDGRLLVTTSSRGVRIWEVTTCQLVSRPQLTREQVLEAQFGPEGSVLALATEQSVYVWPLPAAPINPVATKRLTEVSLGVTPGPEGSAESLPWQRWRDLHAVKSK
jgi:WD40 repeat protein/class 3 adenylate cyclase